MNILELSEQEIIRRNSLNEERELCMKVTLPARLPDGFH